MAEGTTPVTTTRVTSEFTDTREYLIVTETENDEGFTIWTHIATQVARSHEEALRLWALAHPEDEAAVPNFHVVTGSAVKGPLKGKMKPTYSL